MAKAGLLAAVVALAAGLAGCGGIPYRTEDHKPTVAVPAKLTVSAPPAVVADRIAGRLRALGFAVERRASGPRGRLQGTADPAWAICPRPYKVREQGNDARQVRRADVVARSAVVRAAVVPAPDGATAEPEVAFSARLRNSLGNTFFTRPCRSTGFLERDLFRAARRG